MTLHGAIRMRLSGERLGGNLTHNLARKPETKATQTMANVPSAKFQDLKQEQVQEYLHDTIAVPEDLQGNVMVTTLDKIYNWSRKSSMWPLLFGWPVAPSR